MDRVTIINLIKLATELELRDIAELVKYEQEIRNAERK